MNFLETSHLLLYDQFKLLRPSLLETVALTTKPEAILLSLLYEIVSSNWIELNQL